MIPLNLTGPEDGGIGALIVAVVWLIVEWWKKRHQTQSGTGMKGSN